ACSPQLYALSLHDALPISLIGLANIYFFQGRQVEVSALAVEALSLGLQDHDSWVVSFALFLQGTAAFERGEHELAEVRSREALRSEEHTSELQSQSNLVCR